MWCLHEQDIKTLYTPGSGPVCLKTYHGPGVDRFFAQAPSTNFCEIVSHRSTKTTTEKTNKTNGPGGGKE
jgi:hypothetical protein